MREGADLPGAAKEAFDEENPEPNSQELLYTSQHLQRNSGEEQSRDLDAGSEMPDRSDVNYFSDEEAEDLPEEVQRERKRAKWTDLAALREDMEDVDGLSSSEVQKRLLKEQMLTNRLLADNLLINEETLHTSRQRCDSKEGAGNALSSSVLNADLSGPLEKLMWTEGFYLPNGNGKAIAAAAGTKTVDELKLKNMQLYTALAKQAPHVALELRKKRTGEMKQALTWQFSTMRTDRSKGEADAAQRLLIDDRYLRQRQDASGRTPVKYSRRFSSETFRSAVGIMFGLSDGGAAPKTLKVTPAQLAFAQLWGKMLLQGHTAMPTNDPQRSARIAEYEKMRVTIAGMTNNPFLDTAGIREFRWPAISRAAPLHAQQGQPRGAAAARRRGRPRATKAVAVTKQSGSAEKEQPGIDETEEQRVSSDGEEKTVIHDQQEQLTKAQRKLVERALAGGNPKEVLVYHKSSNIELMRGHMACLNDLNWLNDEVINVYIGLLLDRDAERRRAGRRPYCHFFNSFFLNKLYMDERSYSYDAVQRWTLPEKLMQNNQCSESILDLDRVIVPVHLGNHWTCALLDLAGKEVVYYDSLGGREDKILRALRSYISDEFKNKRGATVDTSEWPIRFPEDAPVQHNGCDCGVFALMAAEHLSRGAALDFSQSDMPFYRAKIAADIMTGCII